jgi:RHS repeat-associated protein
VEACRRSAGYDENGNITFLSRTVGADRTYEETRTYGQSNFLSEVIVKGVEIDGAKANVSTTFDPDPAFRVKKITYHDGRTREFTYDHLGHVTQTKTGTYTEDFIRDLHGNVLEMRVGGDLVRMMAYDGHDRLVSITNKTGNGPDELTTMEYFGEGELKKTTARTGADTDLERIVTDVDGLGRPLSESTTGTTASASRSFSYSPSGGLFTTTITGPRDTTVIETDGAGRRTRLKNGLADISYMLDGNDNVEHITSDEDGPLVFKQDFTYDGLDHALTQGDGVGQRAMYAPRFDGMFTSVTDARGKTTSFDFSVLGEVLSRTRPEQIAFNLQYDAARMQRAILDSNSQGNRMDYDAEFRRTTISYRNGATVNISAFDNRKQPTSATIPGGSFTASYDLQARLKSQAITYGAGSNYQIANATFDSLGRLRTISYGTGGTHGATFRYDGLGPIIGADYDEPGGPYSVGATLYEDGMRRTTTYPSGALVEDRRPPNGRIDQVKVNGTVVWESTTFLGAELPDEVMRGGLREINSYDVRKRLLSRRYEKATGGALVEEMRFEYDDTDNLTGRQFLGRGGRGDFFEYDDANRVKHAEIGARPSFGGTVRNQTNGLTGGSVLAAGFFARAYAYDGGGFDLLVSSPLQNPTGFPPQAQAGNPPGPVLPEFMQSLGGHDGYLHAAQLDGASRGGTDPQGNVKSTTLIGRPVGAAEPSKVVASDIKYDGLNHLVGIALPGGITIDYEYQPAGLMHRKTVRQGGTVLADRAFIWDQARLIEERDIRTGSTVVGRYYYADRDWPVAAELTDPTSGQVRLVHYLNDNVYSVVAVADDNGNVLERVSYDTWGQPLIEALDNAAPRLAKITAESSGDLLLKFSETVLPAVQVSGTGIVTGAQSLTGLITLTAAGAPVAGTFEYLEDASGAQFGSVIRFHPGTPLAGNVVVQTVAAKVFDSWGNGNIAETASFNGGVTGDVFIGAIADTSPPRTARSTIGNPILFQGQYFDYDAGLSYMRSRFYDPYTGQFLQRDPLQYEDSVNLYAGLRQGPVSMRDPYGTNAGKPLSEGLVQIGKWLDEVVEGIEADRKLARSETRIGDPHKTEVLQRSASVRVRPPARPNVPRAMSSRVKRLVDEAVQKEFDKAADEVAQVVARQEGAAQRVTAARTELLPQLEAELARGKKLSEKGADEVLTGGKDLLDPNFKGVSMADVRVSMVGDELIVVRKGGTVSYGPKGSGSAAVRGLEEAAVELARKKGASRVTITAENFDNKGWGDWHFSQGYWEVKNPADFATRTGYKFTPTGIEYPSLYRKTIEVP